MWLAECCLAISATPLADSLLPFYISWGKEESLVQLAWNGRISHLACRYNG